MAPENAMQTQVSILHHDYPAPVRDLVESKLEHLVKFYERLVSVRATLERQRDELHRVELVAHVGQGAVLVFDARNATLGAAIDEALSGMESQLKKHNQKQTQERRRNGRHA
jgi:ribosomal subunit interface protein